MTAGQPRARPGHRLVGRDAPGRRSASSRPTSGDSRAEALARAWPPQSRDAAIFGLWNLGVHPLCVLIHFARTRRSVLGTGLGLAWVVRDPPGRRRRPERRGRRDRAARAVVTSRARCPRRSPAPTEPRAARRSGRRPPRRAPRSSASRETVGGMGVLFGRIVRRALRLAAACSTAPSSGATSTRWRSSRCPSWSSRRSSRASSWSSRPRPSCKRFGAEGLLGWGAGFAHAARDRAAAHGAHDLRARRRQQHRRARDDGRHRADRRAARPRHRSHRLPHRAALHRHRRDALHDDPLRRRARALRRRLRRARRSCRSSRGASTTGSPAASSASATSPTASIKSVVFGLVIALVELPLRPRRRRAARPASAAASTPPSSPAPRASSSSTTSSASSSAEARDRCQAGHLPDADARSRARAAGRRARPRRRRHRPLRRRPRALLASSCGRSTTWSAGGARRAPSSSRCTRSATSRSSSSRSRWASSG